MNEELWISNIDYLNDKLENDYSLETASEAIKIASIDSEFKKSFITTLEDHKRSLASKVFVLSFSLSDDSLNIWNNYGKNEGYNIGFNLDQFLSSIMNEQLIMKSRDNKSEKFQATFGKVLYNHADQIAYFSKIINHYKQFVLDTVEYKDEYEQVVLEGMTKIWNNVVTHSYLIKKNHHSIENEFRIILYNKNIDYVHFRSRNGIVLPYLKLCKGEKSLPIKSITCGPKIDDDIAIKGLSEIVKVKNYDIDIKKSEIKLRF